MPTVVLGVTGGVGAYKACEVLRELQRRGVDVHVVMTAHAAEFAGRDNLSLAMSVYSASLGVSCTHCHVEGDWTAATKRTHQTVALMATIFDLIPTYFDSAVRAPRTQCFMCHQGHVAIERAPAKGLP